jgi:Asp-tRNA(Asn)/Glu-tRNA(Gln) amidotransferase C subunit
MSLTQAQILHLQKLTSLTWEDRLEIGSVVDSFSALETVDISHVQQVQRSGKQDLTLREDRTYGDTNLPDKLLACTGQKVAAHQIVLGGIMIGE